MTMRIARTLAHVVMCAAALVATGACRDATGVRRLPELTACPRTSEFGNLGCARIVAVVEGPQVPWPAAYLLDVRAQAARPISDVPPTFASEPRAGANLLQFTMWSPPKPTAGDTLSVWVVARLTDDYRAPGARFSTDSVLGVVRFAAVGAVPPLDTVRLVLGRP
jgi:hypothetical protein